MAQCFKRHETLADAVKRISGERLEHSLACLRDCTRANAVHGVRKDIKKERALLRLVRDGISRKEFRRLIRQLRALGNALSASRDATTRVQAVRDLARHFKTQLAPRALRGLRAELQRESNDALVRFRKKDVVPRVTLNLRRVLRSLQRLPVTGDEGAVLGAGLKRTYRRGRDAYRAVRRGPTPENFHAWRKRAKDLWYQVRVLQPMWPQELAAMTAELHTLGQSLGKDHDLTLVGADVTKHKLGSAPEREVLAGFVKQRQRELRRAALAIGARFYGGKPGRFRDRMMGYWNAWREKAP